MLYKRSHISHCDDNKLWGMKPQVSLTIVTWCVGGVGFVYALWDQNILVSTQISEIKWCVRRQNKRERSMCGFLIKIAAVRRLLNVCVFICLFSFLQAHIKLCFLFWDYDLFKVDILFNWALKVLFSLSLLHLRTAFTSYENVTMVTLLTSSSLHYR